MRRGITAEILVVPPCQLPLQLRRERDERGRSSIVHRRASGSTRSRHTTGTPPCVAPRGGPALSLLPLLPSRPCLIWTRLFMFSFVRARTDAPTPTPAATKTIVSCLFGLSSAPLLFLLFLLNVDLRFLERKRRTQTESRIEENTYKCVYRRTIVRWSDNPRTKKDVDVSVLRNIKSNY